MGEAYLAEDMRPDRKVAIKLLLISPMTKIGYGVLSRKRERLLNPPNILTVHDIGTGLLFGVHALAYPS